MSTVTATISGLAWIPLDWFLTRKLASVKRELTVKPRGFGGECPEPIHTYTLDDTGTLIGLPVAYGLQLISEMGWMDRADYWQAEGSPIHARRVPDPHHPKAAPGQAAFVADLERTLRVQRIALAQAPTGTGKTVSALAVSAALGVTTLVIVPNKVIRAQWHDEVKAHLGFTDDEIGYVEEGEAVWEGKAIVVAVVHNLVQKTWPEAFYEYFGFVIWDECHTLGARSFSQSMYLFAATYKLGMTATPDRKDGCAAIFINYFGPPAVISEAEALACDCIVLPYRKKGKPLNPRIPLAVQLSIVAKDGERNRDVIAYTIFALYRKGRHILCVSDRVEHLQVLAAYCVEQGIPEEAIGLFVRGFVDNEGKKKTVKQAQLDAIKRDSRIIFATYGMFKYAVDVPRLDAGIDATPRSEGTQLIGRIRRPFPGKPRPIWFTVRDIGNTLLTRMLNARLDDYKRNNVVVSENGQTLT